MASSKSQASAPPDYRVFLMNQRETFEAEVRGTTSLIRTTILGGDPNKKFVKKAHASAEVAQAYVDGRAAQQRKYGFVPWRPRKAPVAPDAPLSELDLTGIFRLGAWQRAPGGNAEEFTITAAVRTGPGRAPEVIGAIYTNADGQHATAEFALTAREEPLEELLASAQALVDEGMTDQMIRVLFAPGQLDGSNTYDTEWSVLEFALHRGLATEVEAGDLLVRVTQSPVTVTGTGDAAPPPAALRFLEAGRAIVGVDRPRTVCAGGCDFNRALFVPERSWRDLGRLEGLSVPPYLEIPSLSATA